LPERDAHGAQAIREPVMLIQTDAGRKREIRADADKHPAPLAVEQIEVVLLDPPPRVLEMPAVVFADCNQNARGLARRQDDHDLIGLGSTEVAIDEVVTPARGRVDDRRAPALRLRRGPVVVLSGDVLEHGFAHGVQLAGGVEEADHALGLLKGLNQAVQQDAIEAAIGEPDTILVMLVEGVHGLPPGLRNPGE
jgi:hypothetical protein